MRKICTECGTEFEAKKVTAKYCSDRCRKRAQRKPGATATVVAFGVARLSPSEPERSAELGPLEAAAHTELAAVDRAETMAGAVALALARRIDNAGAAETGSAFAALTKELRAAMTAAMAGAEQAADGIDELRAHVERKRATR